MDYDAYSSNAVELAVALANTEYDDPAGLTAFLDTHRDWFAGRSRLRLSPAERATVADLGRRVRAVVAADTDERVIDRLNALLGLANVQPRMTNHDGSLHVHYSSDRASVLEQLSTTVAVGMALLVSRYGWQRLGICAATDCQGVYVDTSRNNSLRYCSDTCASRATVAAYRARRRDGVSG
ncbi:CGNR zinc finger domain-containing protein [soil metagenome]